MMTSVFTRPWLSSDAHAALRDELAVLLRLQTGGSVDTDVTTVDQDSILHRQHRQARIHQIQDLLRDAVVGQDPPDDGVAEPGMVLTVRYDDENDTDTFLLGLRDEVEQGDMEVYSPESPIGMALCGARRGEQRTYKVPKGDTVRVTLLEAAPYGRHHRAASP
jgi:transcription elongation factor GreA